MQHLMHAFYTRVVSHPNNAEVMGLWCVDMWEIQTTEVRVCGLYWKSFSCVGVRVSSYTIQLFCLNTYRWLLWGVVRVIAFVALFIITLSFYSCHYSLVLLWATVMNCYLCHVLVVNFWVIIVWHCLMLIWMTTIHVRCGKSSSKHVVILVKLQIASNIQHSIRLKVI